MIHEPAGLGSSCYQLISEADTGGYASVKGKIPSGTLALLSSLPISEGKHFFPSPTRPVPPQVAQHVFFLLRKQPRGFCK